MQGDFSRFDFDPRKHERGTHQADEGPLRNVSGVLLQQGRVLTDADHTSGELQDLAWQGQAGRDIIGAGVCAVPAAEPDGFRVQSAAVIDGVVTITLLPGRAWVDGIVTRLAGVAADPLAAVTRTASYFGAPLNIPAPAVDSIGEDVRDAVILEVSEQSLHAFQYPEALIEPALGGVDTAERSYVHYRLRLLRLAPDEDCTTITARLRDDNSGMGHLTVSLAPPQIVEEDCPLVGGGGYTGFEHCLYRIEVADGEPGAPARFKWSQWNGGLAGRGRFDTSGVPAKVLLDAGRAAIIHSGLSEFYLEALQYDEFTGAWRVVYGAMAAINTDHELELTAPAVFGAIPATSSSVFIRLWNGIQDVSAFTNAMNPVELRDGIRLVFDAPAPSNYRAGDYWTFTVRAGEIGNSSVLIDHAPPIGILYHRAPLAEIHWSAQQDTSVSGSIEDCRKRFRPLTNQKICCSFLIGDGVNSFGDFNSLEEAAAHLPLSGGELCLLPGLHRANLVLDGRRDIRIHGCHQRTLVLPRTETRAQPIFRFIDCVGIAVKDLDLATYDGIALVCEGRTEGSCRDIRVHDTRMIGRTNAIRASNVAGLHIAGNRLHLLDTVDGRATLSLHADDVLVERNTLVLLPFVDPTPDEPEVPDDDPARDPADPCAKPEVLYQFPKLVLRYLVKVWTFVLGQLAPQQPYRALGGIHLRAGSERVRILENVIVGGAGHGVILGGDLDPAEAAPSTVVRPSLLMEMLSVGTPEATRAATANANVADSAAVKVGSSGQYLARIQDEQGRAVPEVDLYLEADATATDRSDTEGLANIKTAPGAYTLSVAPAYRVLRVTETREEGVLVNAVTIAPRAEAVRVRGFLHQISLDSNDISMMGLSGIGFALRTGSRLAGRAVNLPPNDPKAGVLAYLDALVANLALTPLLRATDTVRDLVICDNRIHHNLRNPFTELLRATSQVVGLGGITLPIVESAVIRGNHVHENGLDAVDPICGVFIGYGNDVEITGNVLVANGTVGANFEQNRQAGLRGGIYIRFAGALTTQFSRSSGRKPALRVHDNRVDQTAGRALTAFAFGPVSIANNHFNSEHTGRFGFLDFAVGSVLILNLGGIHRLIARRSPKLVGGQAAFLARTEMSLPGGETLFNDNYVRTGAVNRSLMAQLLLTLDDLGYATNTSSVYRGDPLFANTVLKADSVRATAARFREDASRTVSLWSEGFRINTTALNQADHCIVVEPPAALPVTVRPFDGNLLSTAAFPNQVLDAEFCLKTFDEPGALGRWLVVVLAAYANELGGTLQQGAFSKREVESLSRAYTARAMTYVNEAQVTTNKAYQFESARLSAKLGAEHPRTVALRTQANAGLQTASIFTASAEAVVVEVPVASTEGATLSGRLINSRGQGQADYGVSLLRANSTRAESVGRTDSNGYFAASFDEARTARLAKEGDLFLQVTDGTGKEVLRDKTAQRIVAGAELQVTLVLPLRVVPRPVVVDGDDPPPSKVRTSLDKLDLDADTRKRLEAAQIMDVEAVNEATLARIAAAVGDRTLAARIKERAKQVLEAAPRRPRKPPAPRGKR